MKLYVPVLGTPEPRGVAVMSAALLLALSACGGGGGGTPPPTGPAEVSGTLAYVETQCRGDTKGFFEHQSLRIRQGEGEPVTVFETPEVSVPGEGYRCPALMAGRFGNGSVSREAFQSVTVSPDGASVAFEVSDEFSVNPPLPLNLPEDKKGIFWVRADGTGLRPLGPPSREPFFNVDKGFTQVYFGLSFSPDGRTIAFADKGLDADGHEAAQVFTIDVATGTRTQVTHLPFAVPPSNYPPDAPTVYTPLFIDESKIRFKTSANPRTSGNPDGLNPSGKYLLMTIKTDGSDLEVPLPITVALGGQVQPIFVITGAKPVAINVSYPGTPANKPSLGGVQEIWEVFVIDETRNALQLTNFQRVDTGGGPVDADGEHVYIAASGNPLDTNRSENCQLFSIDRLGSDLRQITNFGGPGHSAEGCYYNTGRTGCALDPPFQDPRSRSLIFYSDCDPIKGANPNGGQIFAMRPDGSGLRQLTDSQGLVHETPYVSTGAIPGPWWYGPSVPF